MRALSILFTGVFILGLYLTPSHAFAEIPRTIAQIDFRLGNRGHTVAYHYTWRDYKGEVQKMTFELNRDMVKQSSNEFKPFDNKVASEFVSGAVKMYAQSLKAKGISIDLKENARGEMTMTASSTLPRWQIEREVEKIKNIAKEASNAYFHNRFYRRFTESSVGPDHVRIAESYHTRLKPVSNAITGKTMLYDFRDRVNYILSFLQSIPYDTLENRENSNGSGFVTPVEMLTRNLGDCDSKSVAFASIVRSMYPHIPMIMVFIPGHAFIGIASVPKPGDEVIRIKGRSYVLAEPVGPAIMPMGTLAASSKDRLDNNDYTYVSFE